jgi:hypothetical protein
MGLCHGVGSDHFNSHRNDILFPPQEMDLINEKAANPSDSLLECALKQERLSGLQYWSLYDL